MNAAIIIISGTVTLTLIMWLYHRKRTKYEEREAKKRISKMKVNSEILDLQHLKIKHQLRWAKLKAGYGDCTLFHEAQIPIELSDVMEKIEKEEN